MQVKVVYKTRLHKLPSAMKTLADIREHITNLFKDKLSANYVLFIQTDPTNNELREISNENDLQQVQHLYEINNCQSIKILVQDERNQEVSQQDLDILNQSVMLNKQAFKQPNPQALIQGQFTQNSQSQQTELQQRKDQEISNVPVQQDQGNQFSVPTSDNAQNTLQEQGLPPMINIPGMDPRVVQDYFLALVDCRLRQLKLIPENNQANKEKEKEQKLEKKNSKDNEKKEKQEKDKKEKERKQEKEREKEREKQEKIEVKQAKEEKKIKLLQAPQQEKKQQQQPQQQQLSPGSNDLTTPEMFLKEISNVFYDVQVGQTFEWKVTILNKGKQQWPQGVQLKCISGIFEGDTAQYETLQPGQTQEISIKFTPMKPSQQSLADFKLCYLYDGQVKYFGQKFSFQIIVREAAQNENEVANQSIHSVHKNKAELHTINQQVLEKAQELHALFPHLDIKQLVEFINASGPTTPLDDLVEQCLAL